MLQPDEYHKVELPALDQLQALGWTYVPGADLSPESCSERQYYRHVVLLERLSTAIKRINPWISDENLRGVVRDVRFLGVEHPTLIEANRQIWEMLVSYVSVQQDLGSGRRGQTVKIIDFDRTDNNEFLCANQYRVEGPTQNIIPDVVLFVNGLPLGVIECKSPYITNPMEAGINQLLRYSNQRNPHDDEGAERLFWYNQVMVSTHRDHARIGTISSRHEHYLEWKDPYPQSLESLAAQTFVVTDGSEIIGDMVEDQTSTYGTLSSQQVLIAGVFEPKNFLDLIQNFVVYETVDGRMIKKMARYQQFRAVHKTIERLKTGTTKKDKGGVIWHTQGSGKSLTMVFLALKLRRDDDLKDHKLVFVTDRTQLDRQLTETFRGAQGETVHHAGSVAQLKEFLRSDSSDLVTAMMQKFQEGEDDFEFEAINESDRIIVLTDEAHRTQYGTLGVALNTALPNAPKIAFTGTPLIRTQRTANEFGSYIDQYTIEQAVADGATVQILYEGREAQTKVTGDSLDTLFDEYFGDRPDEEQKAIKQKYGTELAVLEAPQRIRWICIDLLKHYQEHIAPNGFKAMIVTSSRRAAVLYKQTLDGLGAPPSACIISGSHNDEAFYTPYTDAHQHKQQIEQFKQPVVDHPLSIIVVKDMLLTGFDAPICQVMYLDRKLREHTLLQAIARVNRTYEGKSRGFIVDYYGLSDYLAEALDMFTTEDVAGALRDLKDEIPKLQAAHTRAMRHFANVNHDDIDACVLALEDDEVRQQFEIDFKLFCKQMDIIMPDPVVQPYLAELKFLGKVNQGARNLYRDNQLQLVGVGEKVRQLIDEHIRATGVDPKIPPVDLLAADFKKRLQEHKSDRAKASEIEHAIKHHIDVRIEDDPEYYSSLSEKLNAIIERQGEHWDELVQLLLQFRDNIEAERQQQADDLGLTDVEYAFHNILMAEISKYSGEETLDEVTHDEVIQVTKDLVDMLDEATQIVGFFSKQDEIAGMKRKIKRRIVASSFDDEELRAVIMDRFMELAKVRLG